MIGSRNASTSSGQQVDLARLGDARLRTARVWRGIVGAEPTDQRLRAKLPIPGLAGAIEVAGVHGNMLEGMQSNFLILGIIVALMARGHAVAVPLVAFGIAVLEVGASAMQRSAQVPVEVVLIVEALILIFLLLSDVVRDRVRSAA